MRVRIDLKIIVFLILFLFTNQISVYLTMLIFCTLHEFGHIIAGLILKLKPENLEILPYGLSISFKLNPDDIFAFMFLFFGLRDLRVFRSV